VAHRSARFNWHHKMRGPLRHTHLGLAALVLISCGEPREPFTGKIDVVVVGDTSLVLPDSLYVANARWPGDDIVVRDGRNFLVLKEPEAGRIDLRSNVGLRLSKTSDVSKACSGTFIGRISTAQQKTLELAGTIECDDINSICSYCRSIGDSKGKAVLSMKASLEKCGASLDYLRNQIDQITWLHHSIYGDVSK